MSTLITGQLLNEPKSTQYNILDTVSALTTGYIYQIKPKNSVKYLTHSVLFNYWSIAQWTLYKYFN